MTRISKPALRRLSILLVLMAAMSLTMFSCATYCAQNSKVYVDMENALLRQLEEPKADDHAAVIHTTLGDIAVVLYPEDAPVYVEQFERLANEGYYDNTYIYQVEKGVYFSAGSKTADGVLSEEAENAPEEHVQAEITSNLWPFRGALCSPFVSHDTSFWKNLFGEARDYSGTRFLFCNTVDFTEEMKAQMEQVDESAKDISAAFLEKGGIPNYSQLMTVFGQAYGEASFKVIDEITAVAVQSAAPETSYTAPQEDILIEGIDICTWADVPADLK